MLDLSNERFISRLEHRVTEVEEKTVTLLNLLIDLDASGMNTCVTHEMLAVTTEQLKILRDSLNALRSINDEY